MTVPKDPSTASVMWVSEVMTAAGTAALDEAGRGVDLGAHRPGGELPGLGVPAQLGEGDPLEVALLRGAPVDGGVVDVGGDDEDVGVEGAREQGGGEVLVDDGLDAVEPAVGVADDGDAAPAGGDDDVAGGEQRPHGLDVDDLERLGRGDDAAPALVAAVLPDLPVLHHRAGLRPRAGSGRSASWGG